MTIAKELEAEKAKNLELSNQLADAQTKHESLEAENIRLSAENERLEKEVANVDSAVATAVKDATDQVSAIKAENDKLKADAKNIEAEIERRASLKALEITADQGAESVPSNPKTDPAAPTETAEQISKAYDAEKDPRKKAELWAKWKQAAGIK